MMRIAFTTICFFICIFSNLSAQFAKWELMSNGPQGNYQTAVVSVGNSYFVGTNRGLYVSKGIGENWKLISLFQHNQILFLKQFGNEIYANVDYVIYKSTDEGGTWTIKSAKLPLASYSSMAKIGENLIVCAQKRSFYPTGFYFSSDDGESWEARNSGLTSTDIVSIFVNENRIFVGTSDKGIFASDDLGLSWTSKNNGISSFEILSFAKNSNFILVGTSQGLFKTSNNGENWESIPIFTSKRVSSIASQKEKFVITVSNGAFESIDNTKSWQLINPPSKIGDFDMCTMIGDEIFVSEYSAPNQQEFLFYSNNDGLDWNILNKGIIDIDIDQSFFTQDKVFVLTDLGFSVSTDDGLSWFSLDGNNELSEYANGFFYTDGKNIITFGNDGIIVSRDNGKTWVEMNEGMLSVLRKRVTQVILHNNKIYRFNNDRKLLVSDIDNENWTALTYPFSGSTTDFATMIGDVMYASCYDGIASSTDLGKTWKPLNAGLPNLYIRKLVYDGKNLFSLNYDGIYISYDLGNNWVPLSERTTNREFIDLTIKDNLIICSSSVSPLFLVSQDYGVTWKEIYLEFPIQYSGLVNLNIFNDYVFLTTWSDIYRAKISDFLNSIVSVATNEESNTLIYPNPAGEYIEILPLLFPLREGDLRGGSEIKIYNDMGELVLLDVLHLGDVGHLQRIDISYLPAGVYFVKIGDKFAKFVKK